MMMKDSIMMDHLCIECCLFGDKTHKVSKVSIGDILD